MHVKIGDFGLAIKKRKNLRQTVCGTPNYMAPEIVGQKGHGLEVDIWSTGCILYTLLVGTANLAGLHFKLKRSRKHTRR